MAIIPVLEVTEIKVLLAVNSIGDIHKDAKADFKSPLKSFNSYKKVKYEKTITSSKSYDSWSKAKAKLTENEFNKCRRTNVCINCGEVGHTFSTCPKPKP